MPGITLHLDLQKDFCVLPWALVLIILINMPEAKHPDVFRSAAYGASLQLQWCGVMV